MLSKLLCWFGVLLVIEKYLIRHTVISISPRFILVVSWFEQWKSRHCVLLFSWTPVRVVFLNNDVVVFQPRTVTPPYLGSAVNFYASYSTLLNPIHPYPPSAWFLSGGCSQPPLDTLTSNSVGQPHRIIHPPGCHLSLYQHPETHLSLTHHLTTLHPCLLLPFHAFCISNVGPLRPPRTILT